MYAWSREKERESSQFSYVDNMLSSVVSQPHVLLLLLYSVNMQASGGMRLMLMASHDRFDRG